MQIWLIPKITTNAQFDALFDGKRVNELSLDKLLSQARTIVGFPVSIDMLTETLAVVADEITADVVENEEAGFDAEWEDSTDFSDDEDTNENAETLPVGTRVYRYRRPWSSADYILFDSGTIQGSESLGRYQITYRTQSADSTEDVDDTGYDPLETVACVGSGAANNGHEWNTDPQEAYADLRRALELDRKQQAAELERVRGMLDANSCAIASLETLSGRALA